MRAWCAVEGSNLATASHQDARVYQTRHSALRSRRRPRRCARPGGRTRTPFRTLAPEASASAIPPDGQGVRPSDRIAASGRVELPRERVTPPDRFRDGFRRQLSDGLAFGSPAPASTLSTRSRDSPLWCQTVNGALTESHATRTWCPRFAPTSSSGVLNHEVTSHLDCEPTTRLDSEVTSHLD